MNWQRFQGLKVALLGFGQENRSILPELLAVKAIVEVRDRQPIADLPATVTSRCGDDYLADLMRFDWAIKSPGLPWQTPALVEAMELGLQVTTQTQLFFDWCSATIIGVTGTKGKGTTSALIEQLLKATTKAPVWLVGNFGVPALERLPQIQPDDYVIYELSSFQLDRLTKSPQVAVVLPIGVDHLDHHQDESSYHAAKASLVRHQSAKDWAVLAADAPVSRGLARQTVAQVRYFSGYQPVSDGVGVHDDWLVVFDQHQPTAKLLPTEAIPLLGDFYRQNVAAALTVIDCLGLSRSQAAEAVRQFKGLPHRMERVRELGGVLYVNDSKATNPTSTAPALAAYPAIHWILGGRAKTDNLDSCAQHFHHVRAAYTIGEASSMFAALLKGTMPVFECGILKDAVIAASKAAVAGETVLLSPACASFDQFRDFEARGDAFRAAVEALA